MMQHCIEFDRSALPICAHDDFFLYDDWQLMQQGFISTRPERATSHSQYGGQLRKAIVIMFGKTQDHFAWMQAIRIAFAGRPGQS